MADDHFDRDQLVASAMSDTGLDDLGERSWEEGLDRLLDDLVHEARLHELGVEIVRREVTDYLRTRLGITALRNEQPAIAKAPIARPIVIVGQPRTGTTILYDLMAQDPQLRAPLSWEVDRPLPPPDPSTYDTDPRIAEVQETIDLADSLIPGFTDFHPIGALRAQECVRMTGSEFRSMIFNTQYRVPNYSGWLLREADMAPAYRWHRQFLQHLQSRQPAQHWLLKSPAHMWHLEALLTEYPDAVVIQTHRDPLKVVASVSALVAHLRRMASDESSVPDAAASFTDDVFLGLQRSIDARDEQVIPPGQDHHVQFVEFVADPFATIARIYDDVGLELSDTTEQRMRAFLDTHPGDGGGSGTRYRFADTGLDVGELRERAKPYQERFGVESESVR